MPQGRGRIQGAIPSPAPCHISIIVEPESHFSCENSSIPFLARNGFPTAPRPLPRAARPSQPRPREGARGALPTARTILDFDDIIGALDFVVLRDMVDPPDEAFEASHREAVGALQAGGPDCGYIVLVARPIKNELEPDRLELETSFCISGGRHSLDVPTLGAMLLAWLQARFSE